MHLSASEQWIENERRLRRRDRRIGLVDLKIAGRGMGRLGGRARVGRRFQRPYAPAPRDGERQRGQQREGKRAAQRSRPRNRDQRRTPNRRRHYSKKGADARAGSIGRPIRGRPGDSPEAPPSMSLISVSSGCCRFPVRRSVGFGIARAHLATLVAATRVRERHCAATEYCYVIMARMKRPP